jgi:hypothetical protein
MLFFILIAIIILIIVSYYVIFHLKTDNYGLLSSIKYTGYIE